MGSVETIPNSEGGLTYELQEPKPGVSWESMGFTPSEVNGHIECHYHTKSGAWSEPRVVANAHVKVHGLSPALNYGQQAFEGLRVHRDQSGRIRLFRMAAHAARFARSTSAVDIPNVPAALFARAVRLAVALNSEFVPPFEGGCSMYVRPLAYGPGPIMNMYAPDHFVFCVFVTPVSRLYSPVGLRALVIDDFGRTAPRGTGAVKVGGNYGPTLPVMHRAREKGYNLTLHLDSTTNSFIHEFSASGFIGVRREQDGSHVVVIPRDPDILPSITVDSTGVIAESLGWKVERRQIPVAELAEFTEVFTVGTASSLVTVREIIRESTGEHFQYTVDPGSPQSACYQLMDKLEGIKRGVHAEQWGWLETLDQDCLLADAKGVVRNNSD